VLQYLRHCGKLECFGYVAMCSSCQFLSWETRQLGCTKVLRVTTLMHYFHWQVDPSKAFDQLGKFSYDSTNMRTRFIEEVNENQERSYYDELFLFKEVSVG